MTILRPVLITEIPLFIVSFQPMFLWIAALSVFLLGTGLRTADDGGMSRRRPFPVKAYSAQ